MKLPFYFITILMCGCSSLKATYLEKVSAGTLINRSLYLVSVPQQSPEDKRKWERYSKDGKSDDLILKSSEGMVLPSYAATIQVTKKLIGVFTVKDLKRHAAKDQNYMKFATSKEMQEIEKSQEFLLCIKPAFHLDAAPERPVGFFWHRMACIDSKTHNYYEINLSYMTKRNGSTPPENLEILAESFFASFSVKDYSK